MRIMVSRDKKKWIDGWKLEVWGLGSIAMGNRAGMRWKNGTSVVHI